MDYDLTEFVNLLLEDTTDANLALPDPSLVQYYIDLKNRTIWIDAEIKKGYLDIVSKIILWNREDKDLPVEERQPIKIMFNSPGGDLDVADTLIDVIHLSKTPVYGFALGMVASAASIIYLSCHKRFALPNSYWIFHQGSASNLGGSYSEIQAAMEDYRIQVEKMEKFYIENTTYPEETVKQKIKSDWYIYLEEAKKYNIVTDELETIDELL